MKRKTLCENTGKTFRFVHPSPDAITHAREGWRVESGWGRGRQMGEEKLDQTQILDLHYGEAGGGE